MNIVMISGRVERIDTHDSHTVVVVRVMGANGNSYAVRCYARGGVENYVQSEIYDGQNVIVYGSLSGKTIKTDNGFSYYCNVNIHNIAILNQLEYGGYRE